MLPTHIALVSETPNVPVEQVLPVAAALQKQVTRDFGPIWGIEATVDAFASLEDIPLDYWPVMLRDDIGVPGAAGVHEDKDGQPFALVQASNHWDLTASHEVLEMLADPFGRRLVAGESPKEGQGRVMFLVEVSDPSEAEEFSYTINGITMSDFYTPRFFDPVAASGVRYSFTGAIQKPRQVLKGGYLSWFHPPTGNWWQETWFSGTKSKFVNLGRLDAAKGSFRSQIDHRSNQADIIEDRPKASKSLKSAMMSRGMANDAKSAKAKSLRDLVKSILSQ